MFIIYFARTKPHAGSWGDLTTFHGFMNHFRRKDYGTFTLFSGNDNRAESALTRTMLWMKDLSFQSSELVIILLCFGSFIAWKHSFLIRIDNSSGKKRSHFRMNVDLFLGVALIFYLIIFHSLSNLPLHQKLLYGVHQRFWMQPHILAFILVGYGLSFLCLVISRYTTKRNIIIVLFALASFSFKRGYISSVQSDNYFFHNYARGILDSLPSNSLLFINYDQQWTSIRYMQECEHIRPDITSINLSMMSYNWFQMKQSLYPNVTFPGTHYTQMNSIQWENGGFSFSELLEQNFDSFKGRVFIGGILNYDEEHLKGFEEIPFGMTRQFVRRDDLSNIIAEEYRRKSALAWRVIGRYHEHLPDIYRYNEETWEWTIVREFYSHWLARATYLLDLAVKANPNNEPISTLPALIESALWLEYARLADTTQIPQASLLKNVGLAYLHLVRTPDSKFQTDHISNSFTSLKVGNIDMSEVLSGNWIVRASNVDDVKTWASSRWNLAWKEFLLMEDAQSDPSFEQIKFIYDQVNQSAKGKN